MDQVVKNIKKELFNRKEELEKISKDTEDVGANIGVLNALYEINSIIVFIEEQDQAFRP